MSAASDPRTDHLQTGLTLSIRLTRLDPALAGVSFWPISDLPAGVDDARTIPIAYGDKVYKIPHNYLVDLDRPNGDPNDTSFKSLVTNYVRCLIMTL